MKKNRWSARLLVLLMVFGVAAATVSLAADAGSSGDPLVTLSYLNETFYNTIMAKVDQKIAERGGSGGTAYVGGADTFSVVTLSEGQTLMGNIGCEVMLRVGTATCVAPSSPGLVDETGGSTISGGTKLTQNHLYMMTITDRGVKAGSGTTKLLVRGGYSVS